DADETVGVADAVVPRLPVPLRLDERVAEAEPGSEVLRDAEQLVHRLEVLALACLSRGEPGLGARGERLDPRLPRGNRPHLLRPEEPDIASAAAHRSSRAASRAW